MTDANEIGDFLRAHRDRLTPEQVGLPLGGDRRVPGLRREEVALLAGVSFDYYSRLEQGKERRPSEQVLDAVACALQLDAHATDYLFRVARPAPRTAAVVSPAAVSPELQTLMVQFQDVPAVVVGPALDFLAANPLARALYRGFTRMDNQLRMMFLDPVAPEFYIDWDAAARSAVGNFRAAAAAFPDDPRVLAVVGELAVRSHAFSALWAEHEVAPRTSEDKRLRHPDVGTMTLRFQAFAVTAAPGQQLFTYSGKPSSSSSDALKLLATFAEPHEESQCVNPSGHVADLFNPANSSQLHNKSTHRQGEL